VSENKPIISRNPLYPPERLRGFHASPVRLKALKDGERSEKWRIRTRTEEDYLWLKGLSSPQRGELIAWARAQGWRPAPEDEEVEEPEVDEPEEPSEV